LQMDLVKLAHKPQGQPSSDWYDPGRHFPCFCHEGNEFGWNRWEYANGYL
jgi:hypothetical protein